jgi:hypothetical protein
MAAASLKGKAWGQVTQPIIAVSGKDDYRKATKKEEKKCFVKLDWQG